MIRLRKARLSAGIVVGVAALVTPIAAMSGSASAAPTTAGTYHGTAIASNRVAQAGSISGLKAEVSSFSAHGPRALTHFAARGLSTVGAADAPSGGASTIGGPNGLLQNFNGLSDLDQAKVNGGVGFGEVTPPDQGMCIGRDPLLPGSPKVAFEAINSAVRETTPSGAPLRPDFSLATLFQDPFAQGDPRCLYDAAARTFYFTEIGYPPGGPAAGPLPLNTTVEVAVWNANGIADYAFDTSRITTTTLRCFGDQPKTGFDNDALIISTDEYCGFNGNTYEGALAIVISKAQLVSQAATVDAAELGPVSLAGNPVVGLDPAINTGSGTGYFVNSVPFLANGDNNPLGTTLGLWTLTNTAAVVTNPAAITLSGTSIDSEPYAFPVPATSTGTGAITTVDGIPVQSETALNPDDSRLSGPVSVTHSAFGGTAVDRAGRRGDPGGRHHRPRRRGVVRHRRRLAEHRPAGVRDRRGRLPALPGDRGAAVRHPGGGVHHHQQAHQPERGLHRARLEPHHHGGLGRGRARKLRRSAVQPAPLG